MATTGKEDPHRLLYDDGTVAVEFGSAASVGLPDESVAAVVTSPPYNAGIEYEGYDDSMSWTQYQSMAEDACAEMFRVVMPTGRVWLNVAPFVPERPTSETTPATKRRIHLAGLWERALREAGFLLWDTVVWVSPRGAGTAWGSWQSPTSPNLRGDHEVILVAYKESWLRHPPEGFDGWRDKGGNWQDMCRNVWQVPPARRGSNGGESARDGTHHPVPFPMEIARRAIRLSTWPGEMVLDPFCGSGTTLAAAKELSRRGYGVDYSKKYCLITANRVRQGSLFSAF